MTAGSLTGRSVRSNPAMIAVRDQDATGRSRALALSLMFVFMIASMTLASLAMVTGELQQKCGLSSAQIGLLSSVFMGFFAVSGLLSGLFASRWGGRLLLVTCGCFAAGSLIIGMSSTFAGLAAGRAIQGAGGGMVVSVCNPLMARALAPDRLRRCLGIFGCGWGLGQAAALLILPSINRAGGFRAVFFTIALLAILAAAGAMSQPAVRARTPRAVQAGARGMAHSVLVVAGNPRLLLLGLTSAAQLAVSVGILVWTPSLLQAHRGASLAFAAYVTASLGASQALGNLAGAAAAGRWGKQRVILVSLAVMTVAAVLVPLAPNNLAALAMVMVAGFCSFALFPPMIASISQVVAPEHVGPATGVHTVVGFSGSLVAPWIFGLVLDAGSGSAGSYLEGYLILAAFGAAGVIGMSFFRAARPSRASARTACGQERGACQGV